MLRQFYTIDKEVTAEIEVKKSEFIADIFSISNEQDFKEKMNFVKKKFNDARHHVFAYRLADGLERYSDDGEPAGTAGVPILDILRGNNLHDVLVVVTRYFGGTLLGTGGLVKAYSDAAKLAIEKAKVIEKFLAVEYELEIPYNDYNIVQHYCSTNGFVITNSSFSDIVQLQIVVKEEEGRRFTKELCEILDGKVDITMIKENFYI
ncbi:MAG: YigZ family protein [Clostridia bacterium]|nr:YigZ family protein [Clostridia bacterium]